jgi:hypothetical protein
MRKWVLVSVLAGVVVLGAYAWAFTSIMDVFKPSITGDRATDATCAAAFSPFIVDGQPVIAGKFTGMTSDERREMARQIEVHYRDVKYVDVRDGAQNVLGSLALAGDGGLFGTLGLVHAYGALGSACSAHGWDAKKAGLW